VCFGAGFFTSLSHHFLVCKMSIIMAI
jgi:hypothetical protein